MNSIKGAGHIKIKRALFVLISFLIAGIIFFVVIISQSPDTWFDIVGANDVTNTVAANWDNILSSGEPVIRSGLQYAIYNETGRVIYHTGDDMSETLNDAIRDRYIIMDVVKGGQIVGKVGFLSDIQSAIDAQRSRLIAGAAVMVLLLVTVCAVFTAYLFRRIVAPFNKMQSFAQRVASGDLDIPLAMDKSQLFGAFTESFDIMREELHRARESERDANRSKKELVASLSHDIKTPLATIKAVTEVMAARTCDEKELERLKVIEAKTEQINSLVTNMFHATLEELQELKVAPAETSSRIIPDLIRSSDYEHRIRGFTLPECIVLSDTLRLSQVFDNIVSNSYKYAGTPVEVISSFEEDCLIIAIRDFGKGVPDTDIHLVTGKFFRGKNAEGKAGYGLGLYISKYLMNQMRGDLICENLADGFSVKVILRLV